LLAYAWKAAKRMGAEGRGILRRGWGEMGDRMKGKRKIITKKKQQERRK